MASLSNDDAGQAKCRADQVYLQQLLAATLTSLEPFLVSFLQLEVQTL